MTQEIDSDIPHVLAEVDEREMVRNSIRFERHLRECQSCRFGHGITNADDPSVRRELIIHFVETER